MSKLRKAVSKSRLRELGQDLKPPKLGGLRPESAEVARVDLRGRKRRVKPGTHRPANENAGQRATDRAQAASDEPLPIRAARQRLRAMIEAVSKDAPRPSIGIVLAIVNQETGNHAAANALIDEYGLESMFGIKKFWPNG